MRFDGRIIRAIGVGALLVSVASCASEGAADAPTQDPTAVDTEATPTEQTGFFGHIQTVACDLDLGTFTTAVDFYVAMNGSDVVTEQQLVESGQLREESTLHDIGPGNIVIPSPRGGCVS